MPCASRVRGRWNSFGLPAPPAHLRITLLGVRASSPHPSATSDTRDRSRHRIASRVVACIETAAHPRLRTMRQMGSAKQRPDGALEVIHGDVRAGCGAPPPHQLQQDVSRVSRIQPGTGVGDPPPWWVVVGPEIECDGEAGKSWLGLHEGDPGQTHSPSSGANGSGDAIPSVGDGILAAGPHHSRVSECSFRGSVRLSTARRQLQLQSAAGLRGTEISRRASATDPPAHQIRRSA